ncbi:Leucine-rich repeat transmembrane protein CCDC168 [Lemmus lemmus]
MVNTPELAAPCSFDLNIPKHEGLSGVISESAQKDASFPQIGSNREMKVQKDIETTENGEKLAVGTAAIQKCFSKDSVQNTKNSGEIILNFPDISLLISLGSQKHEENEFKDINVQVTIEYGSPSESEKPKCDTRSNKTNRHQDERKSDTYRNTTHATISQPFDMEMCNKLKANAGTLTINCNHTALKQEELLDEKKIQEVKHIDKSSILRKPQEWDSEEEGKRREPVRPLAEAFRVSICLKQKDKYAHFEMEPIQSGKRKIQSTKKEIQSQTISTQTVWETGPCQIQSLTNPIQVEQVKQRTDKPPDRDKDASPVHPVLMPENSPAGEYLIETTRYKAPFCGKATKPPDNHITEDKENLKKDLCAVTTGPFKVRKKSSGPKNVLSVKHKIIKVKKPAFSSRLSITARDTLNHKRKVGDSFESLIKQALHDVTLATVLLNVHPQGSSIHRNKINIKITPPKTQVEKKEKNLDSLNKESKTVDTLEVQLCRGVKLVEQVLSETVAHVKRNHRCDAHPVKEIKMEKELFQGVSSTEAIRESVDSLRMDSFCVANTKPGTSTRSELQYSAELKLGPQTLEKLLTGDPLVQSRERNVPSSKNDTREISCGFTQKASSCSLNSVLTHSKMKKSQTRFTNKSTTLRLKYMNKVKPPASKTLSTTGNKKNPKLDLKTILERINHAKSFLPESQNTLCLFIDRRLRGGFCHAQLKQGELASKICVDSVAESKAFYNREEKRQERQEPLVQASPQHNQHQWAVVHQRKATPPDEPDPSPISLSREQPANRQGVKCRKDSLQSALEDSLQMAPIQAEGCQKTTKTENGVNFPVVPKSLSLEAGNSSPGEFTDIADNDLESDEKSEHELDLYPVGKDSESRSLLDLLQSSDSVTRYFASRRKEKKQALRSKKQTTMSHRYRAMREIKTSDSQTINFRYSNKLNHVGMNDPQQRGSMAGACLEIIHSKVNILSNKERRRSKSRAGKQKIRLGCMQQMQEKSPYGGNAQCLASADVSSSPSVKNNEEEGEEGPERFLDTKKSPHLIRDVHQEKDHGLVKSDTQLNQVGRSLTQGLAAVMLGSLSFSTPTSKESENLEILDKGNEMINSSLTVKTRKEAISQTLIASGCGTPKRGKPMAGSSLNVISPMPVCLDLNTCDEIKETDWKSTMRLSCKLLERSVHNEKAWWTHYMNKDAASNGTEDVQGQGGEEDPLTSQHFSFSVQNMTEPNSTQSGLQQINSATYPELERTLYNGKAQPVNVSSLQSSMVSVMSPLLNTEEPEIGSIPCDNTCDEGPRRKCDYAISEQKAWAEKDLTSLEPLQERSPVSSESKCEGCTLEFSGKKDRSPKARQASRLLHIARSHTRVHRKNRHHKGKQQLRRDECVGEALLYAVEDAESCPLKLPTDELSLDTAARADFSSRRPQRSSAEEKAEFEASLSTTFLRPFDFIIPVLSDFKSQEDTVKLSENKIMLNRRLSTMKKKKISVSKIIKIDGHFITNHKKFKLRAKMKTIWLRENTTGVFQNIIHFLLTNSNVENPFKTEVGLGVSKSTRTQPAHGASPVEGIAECGDSVETVGSNFLKEAKVHVGQCWREKQEVLIEPDPFYMKNLTASAHLMKKPSLEESKRILFREYLPQKSQTYEANPEINVKIEKNNMQVSLKEALSGTKKFHNCPEVSGSTSNTTKHGVKNTGQSSLKEKTSFYLTGIITSIARHLIASKEFKRHLGSMRSPNLSIHKGILSQMKPRESQPPHRDRAAINIKETQGSRTLEIKVDNGEVNTDMNSTSMCVPIKQINMESSQNVWHMYEKSSKGSGLDKAPTKRKEECARLPFGADQRRHPGPFKSDVPSTNTVHGKDSTLQKTAIYLIDQEGNAKVGEEFNQEVVLSSNSHTLQTERQNSEFKTDWKTNSKSFALPENQEKPNVLGPTWSSHASDTTYPEAIRQKDKAKISNVTTTVCAKQIKLKAKKIPVPLLLRNGDSSNKKELGHSMQHQHQNALEQRKMVQNLVLKPNLGLGCFIPPVTKLTSVKLEKGKLGGSKNILPQKILEKPSNQRQKSGSGCVDVPRKREENIKEAHDHCTFKDIHQQFVQQFLVKSEEIKEHHSCKLDNLQRNSEFTSQKNETDNVGLATSRNRGGTKVYIGPQDSLQQEYPLKQGICRQEMIPQTMKEFPHFGMTNKFIQKQDIKTSSLQTIGEMEVMENSLDPKESSLIPRLMVQQQNMFTDPLLGSIPSQVPCQPYIEEPKENMKVSDKLLTNSTPQLKKVSNAEYISDMDHIPRSIEKLLLLIKEQEKRRKRSRRGKNFETAEDIKATMKNPTPFLNNSPPRTQFINTIKNSGVFEQRDGTEPNRSVATLWTQQRSCVQGTSLDYVYTQELTSKVIRHNKRRAAFREGILYHRTIKKKVRKTTLGKLLSIAGYGAHSYRKELRHSIKTQKELPKGKTVADFLWKDFCASGYTASQIKKLREVKEGKGKPQRPSNGTKMLSTQPTDSNSTVSTIRKSVQYTMKQKEQQVLLLDITPQNKDQLMPGQQVEEPRHINLSAHLEKEAYHVVFPETEETDSSTLEAQRPRADTDCEFLTAQRGEQGVRKDFIKHTLSVPPRRGGPEKMNISSSKEHDVFLMELDTFQKETCKMQELFKQGNPSQAGLENDTCPFRESFHLESAKEVVLNMKFLEKKVRKGKSELAVVATRSFLSLPSLPSEDKTQRGTGHSFPQGNFQEAADAQGPATRESAAVDSDCIVKVREYNVLQKSKTVTSARRISEHPQVEMEYESDPKDHKIHLTRLGTIKKEKMLGMSFKGQKGQPEKCEKEPSAKIGHWKKENEFKDNLSNKTSPKFSVSPTKISLKEALVTSDTLACSKRSGAERKEETGSGSFMTSEKDRQSNASLSKMLIPAKMSQNKEEQNVNMEEQAMPQSKSGQLIKSKSFSPNVPVHSKNQRLLLQTDVDKKTAVSIILQAQSGVHMSTTEFNATRRKEDSPSIVQEQEQCDRALPQKSHESPLKSEHLEETHTSSDENLKQTKLEMDSSYSASQKEGALKAGGGRGVALEEDRREMQQRCIFQLGNKAREHTCTTTSHALPPATEKPEIETQVGTARENGYPPQEQLKRELEVCTAKQNVQGQKLLQTSMPNSLYVYIPDYPKSQKSRFAKTNLKRELKPKYLTLRIPKHPISKTLGITGCGSSSRKRKLEYAFNKPKTMVPSSKCTSMISPPHNKGTVELETIPRKEKRVCHPEFQKKLPDARVTKNILTGVKELSKLSMHLVSKATEIKLNQMPEIVNISCQKCNSQPQRTISEDYSCRLHLKHIRTNFTSPKAGTIHNNLESNYQRDFPPFSCVKTMSVSNSSEVMTKAKGIKKRVTSLETGSHILQKFSEKGKDNLLLHFETKALEIKTTSLPRTAAHSYAMASAQDKSKRLFTCIHSTTKEQKRTNRVLVLFDKKSLCEIDRDLQCKYLRSILRPSIPVVSKANGLPKHTYKLDVGSGSECKTVEDRGERLLFDVGLLQHVAFQNKNPRESSFFTRKFQEPPHVLGFSAGLQRTEQNDIMIIPSELKLQMKPEKDKKCHVCFQETSLYKHNIPGTQQNTADLASSYSSGISDDWTTDVPLNTETSTDLVECSASDLAEGPSSDLAEGPSSDLAERPSSDLAERSSSDLAERPSSDLAERSSSDLAERPSSDLAERSSSDLVECPSSDLAECPSSDLKECPSSDLVESPSSDLAERPSSDLAERPSSDLVERPSSDLVESPSSDLAECPSSDLATSDLAKRPSSDLAERPASDLVECPSSDLAERPSSDLAERPSSDLAECPASDLAESPASGLAGHPASDLAERPSSDLAECPASDLAECTSSDLAKRPSSDLAERPSSHLAERPSSHLAECPAFDLVECLASDLVECPSFDPVECPSSDLAECTSSDLAECPASEESDSEECVFIGNNFYSTQGLQKFLFEVPKAISLANLHRVDGATPLKPVYHEDPNDYHTRTHRRHASPVAQPCYQSGNTRKHRLNSKMQSPDGLCHSPSHIVEIESTTSSITVSEGKHQAATTWSRTRYSLTSSATESDTKSNIPKKYGKSYTNPLVKERRKAKSDLWRKFNVDQCSNYRHSHSGEKHGRKKRLYHYESEESNPPTNRMPEPRAHQENIKFYPERRENQPFFYACVPADSMDVIPQTIRWLIPSKILQKSHFHIPQVANISKSWNLCSSSKKLLGSLAEAFNIVRHG